MQNPCKKNVAVRDEISEVLFEEDGKLVLTSFAHEKPGGLHGFFFELIEAHRYVNNRRTASNSN